MDPEVIVADEPVSMLDVSIRTELLRLMLDLRVERGLTYLFITHDLSLAWVIADRIAVMYLGKIMEIGPAEAVIRSPRNPYTQGARLGLAVARSARRRDPRASGRSSRARRRTPPHVPTGCRFHPRCPVAFDRCRVEEPPLFDLGGGQSAACWLVEKDQADAVARPCDGTAATSRRRARPAPATARLAAGGARREPHRRARARIASPICSAASAATVVAELLALGDDGGWRPEPGEWSANECVGHLIEAERRGFAGRIRTILAATARTGRSQLEAWDPPAVAEARRDHLRSGAGAGRRVRRRFAPTACASSAGSRPADMARVGIHPEVGPLRVDELLGEWVHHDRNHVRQMLAVTQARVWRPDGQRPTVLPRGPLAGARGGQVPRSSGSLAAIVHDPEDAVADDAADDRADDVDPQLAEVAADERRADRPGRVDRRAGERGDREVDRDQGQRDRDAGEVRDSACWTRG